MSLRPSTLNIPRREKRHMSRLVYLIAFFTAIHFGLIFYSSSSFLSEHIKEQSIGLVFSLGAVIAIIALAVGPYLLKHMKNHVLLQTLIALDGILLLTIAFTGSLTALLISFVTFLGIVRLIPFSFDVFLEDGSDDATTGDIRGFYLTALNIGLLMAPLILGSLLRDAEYWKVFVLAALLLIPISISSFVAYGRLRDPEYDTLNIRTALAALLRRPDVLRITLAATLLFTFYSWMVIYTPIYLINHVGFDWSQLGPMFTIMLLPFVFLEIPLGRIADSWLGEKELLIAGFGVMGISVAILSFITSTTFVVWATMLFVTRIGASMVEIMSETYFFKQISSHDTHLISLFRMSRPVGHIVGPLCATFVLLFVDIRYVFVALGAVVLSGIFLAARLTDTK